MKHRNVQLETVLTDIESQTDYLFLYNGNQIDVTQNVSVNAKNMPVSQVLNDLFSDSQVNYVMEGTHIVLLADRADKTEIPKSELANFAVLQTIRITGKVTDIAGDPLPGVTVSIKGTSQGTATDGNGFYTIQVPDRNTTLVFSYIGYVSNESLVGDRMTIDIILKENVQEIAEVIVVAY